MPKARKKAHGAVDRIDENQHICDVSRDADRLEEKRVPLDFFVGRQSRLHTALLHLGGIQMHHADSAVSDAEGAHENEQDAQFQAFKNRFQNQLRHFKYLPHSASSDFHTGYCAPFSS